MKGAAIHRLKTKEGGGGRGENKKCSPTHIYNIAHGVSTPLYKRQAPKETEKETQLQTEGWVCNEHFPRERERSQGAMCVGRGDRKAPRLKREKKRGLGGGGEGVDGL